MSPKWIKPEEWFTIKGVTQKNCKYGFVLPDRCRYNPLLGCDCGEYPAMVWNEEEQRYVQKTRKT